MLCWAVDSLYELAKNGLRILDLMYLMCLIFQSKFVQKAEIVDRMSKAWMDHSNLGLDGDKCCSVGDKLRQFVDILGLEGDKGKKLCVCLDKQRNDMKLLIETECCSYLFRLSHIIAEIESVIFL